VARRGYSSSHGNPSGILQQEQGQSSAGPEDARPPGFPSVEELKELNRKIHDDAGSPERFKLDQPSPLATLSFLQANGYGHLSPIAGDDHSLARYLNQVVEDQTGGGPGPEKFASLFSRRLQRDKASQLPKRNRNERNE
jgi:hypothetical protein